MKTILVILQNAWRKKAQYGASSFDPKFSNERAEKIWERALWASHSGKRLKEMLPENCIIKVTNASPYIGNKSSILFPYNKEHVQKELERFKPDFVLLCGNEAQKAEELLLEIPFLKAYHPAYRLLSKQKTKEIKDNIERYI